MIPPPAHERATACTPALIYRTEMPELYRLVDALADRGGVPRVSLFYSPEDIQGAAAAEPLALRITLHPAAFNATPAQTLALMAHEMGHIAHRHGPAPWLLRWFRPFALAALVALLWAPPAVTALWATAVVAREAWMRRETHRIEREADEWAASVIGAAAVVEWYASIGGPLHWTRRVACMLQTYPMHRPWIDSMVRKVEAERTGFRERHAEAHPREGG